MIWITIIISGMITYFLRASSLVFIKKEMLNEEMRAVLSYVPSAIFPAIIFPAVFLDESFVFVDLNDPKIIAAFIAIVVGYLSKNVIATIVLGMISYWMLIFVIM